MGMYTEFHLEVVLKDDTPDMVIQILNDLLNNDFQIMDYLDRDNELHQFFNCPRCESIFSEMRNSDYQRSTMVYINMHYCLLVNSYFKNYHNEIILFLDWITPYLGHNQGEHLGWFRYEESDDPTEIYYKDGWYELVAPKVQERYWI